MKIYPLIFYIDSQKRYLERYLIMWKIFSKFVSRVDSACRSPSGDSCTFVLQYHSKLQNLRHYTFLQYLKTLL